MYTSAKLLEIVSMSFRDGYIKKDIAELLTAHINEHGDIPEDYVITCMNYIIHFDDSITTSFGNTYHESIDIEEYVWDEIDQEYIDMNSAESVRTPNGVIFTLSNNCNSFNDIYYFSSRGEYVSLEYMHENNIVIMPCGTLEHDSDVYYWESDGEYHYDEELEQNVADIHSYSYKPRPSFKFATNEKRDFNHLFFGIELEVENVLKNIRNENGAYIVENALPTNMVYMKNDGSLNNGFEIVSHPLTFNYIKENESKIVECLKELSENGFRSYNSDTCGMHIHISKNSFTTWQLYRFMEFFQKNKEFILKISQRNAYNLDRWAALTDDSKDTLIYKTKCAKKCKDSFSRYSAININNSNTIEIRIFRGTLAAGSFLKNIEFCEALFNYTRDNSIVDIKGFKEYISDKKEYRNLVKFIKAKNI